jgi:hypothetical protein
MKEDVEDPVTGEIITIPIFNVLDIVILANCVLVENCGLNPDGSNAGNDFIENGCAADLNGDTAYNVLDIVILANCVLANNCGGRVDDASEAALIKNDNKLSFEADGFIGGVQMTLTHGSDFTIEMTDRALVADYLTTGNETICFNGYYIIFYNQFGMGGIIYSAATVTCKNTVG